MKKKLLLFCIVAMVMFVSLTVGSVVFAEKTSNTFFSPLYNIRTKKAVNNEKIFNIKDGLKIKFLHNRQFFIPVKLLKIHKSLEVVYNSCTDCGVNTCWGTSCSRCTMNHPQCTFATKTCDSYQI